nr:RNA-dependent RNA polymerase [Nodaviridae sp.]
MGDPIPVELRKGCWIKFPNNYDRCKTRVYRKIHTQGTWDVQIHSDCYHNQLRSLYERVLAITPQPVHTALKSLRLEAKRMAQSLGHCYPATLDTVLLLFPKHKQKVYAKARKSFFAQPLEAKDCNPRAFVKCEKLRQLKAPRMIQYRTTRFNLMLGRYTRPMEHLLYKLKDLHGNKLIAKGMNSRQRAKHLWGLWNQVEDPVALSLDLTRWDLHCNKELIKIMHLFYLTITPDEELRDLLQHQLINTGLTSHGIRYRSQGGVMSGDMTTALGNCALLVIIVSTLFKAIVQKMPGLQWRMIDDGDDFVVVVNRSYAKIVASEMKIWFDSLGHVLKVEQEVSDFHQIQFCQSKPLRHHGILEMVPDPHKVLATAFTIVGKREQREYLSELWKMRAILHQGQPVLGPIFLYLSEKYPTDKPVKIGLEYVMSRDARDKVVWRDVENESRILYAEQWGWDIDEQLAVEAWYKLVEMPGDTLGPNELVPWNDAGWPQGHCPEKYEFETHL